MGSLCCCLREECEDFADPNSLIFRNCFCLRCFVLSFLNVYMSLFQRGQDHGIASSNQSTSSFSPTASLDNSLSDMYCSPPRPLPYDTDPRCFRLQCDGLVSGREKSSSHLHEETEPLRRSDVDEDSEPLSTGSKWNEVACEAGQKEQHSKSSLKHSKEKMTAARYAYICSSSEDEDICPTCLEEYTAENPKMITKCSHHFHLGCIFEWMERSESCPVCGKVMVFEETT